MRIQLAPANLHWCSDKALTLLSEASSKYDAPMHMHLNETAYQKEYAWRRGTCTALEYIDRFGMVNNRLTLGHGVWLSEKDIDRLADLIEANAAELAELEAIDNGKPMSFALGVDVPGAALLATAAVHHHLIRKGLRTSVGLVVESGEPREVHHFSLLIGYGCSAINPYVAFETIDDKAILDDILPLELTLDQMPARLRQAGREFRDTSANVGVAVAIHSIHEPDVGSGRRPFADTSLSRH